MMVRMKKIEEEDVKNVLEHLGERVSSLKGIVVGVDGGALVV